ncbi:MAG: nucleotidyltransferase domain-containing protein [Candidatus Xenobia bacterium]
MQARLVDRPRLEHLKEWLEKLLADHGDNIAFIVLRGSMARGDWSRNSDFDLLVGLRDGGSRRLMDRLRRFDYLDWHGDVEALYYGTDAVKRMFCSFNLVILTSLRDGITVADDGTWARYQARYRHLIDTRMLISEGRSWEWTEAAEAYVGTSQE